jgi:hypothetical protein
VAGAEHRRRPLEAVRVASFGSVAAARSDSDASAQRVAERIYDARPSDAAAFVRGKRYCNP